MKRLLLILSLVCFAISTWAGQITRNQALLKAQQFLSQKGLPSSLTFAETHASRHRAQGAMQPDYYYVFNAGPDQGFVIVSGDDRTETVLGYATSGNFDVDNIPPAMADLLNYYAAQIEAIQQGALVATRSVSHPQVAELMTVKWNQGEPYNNKTPLGYYSNLNDGFHCLTGCVATAMAQVLYHQRFVNATQATIPGYQNYYYWKPPSGDKYAYLADIPSGSALEWDKMVDNYEAQTTTQDQKDAVANLMLYCGTAVNMQYNLPEGGGSSASVSDIPDVFKKYFGYSRGTRYVSRDNYSDSDWDNLIYNEIASGRPVIYGGQTAKNEGHAFVVHGYDGNGNYAINWGWGGYQDNYFYLSDLTPKSQGMGGGSGGYNYGQEAVIYLTKEDGTFKEDVIATVFGAAVGDVNFDNFVIPTGQGYQASRNSKGGCVLGLAFTYTSDLANVYAFDLGYGIQDSDGNLMGDVVTLRQKWDLTQGQTRTTATGTSNFAPGISEGTYYIKAYSCENGTTDWSVCKDADKFAIKMVVSSSTMKFEVVDISTPDPEPQPEVSQADLDALAGLYAAQKTAIDDKITAIASNDKKLTAIAQSLSQKKTSIESLETKISAIENMLKSEYLTASQKKTYRDELDALKAKRDAQVSAYNNANQELTSLQSSSVSLKATLNSLLTDINTEAAKVSSITTTAALNASKKKVAEITSQQSDCNVSAETAKVTALESDVAKISATQVETGLTTLESNIDAAIDAAKQTEQEDQEKKKLEENKKALEESYDKLKADLAAKQQLLTENENTIASLEGDIKKAKDAIDPIEKKIAEIKESLNNDILSADKKASFQRELDAYDKVKSIYADDLNALEAKLATAQKSNEELKANLEKIAKLIDSQIEAIKNISTDDELSKAKTDKQDAESQLGKVDPDAVGNVLHSLKTELEALDFDGIAMALESLESVIQQVIAQAIAIDEYEKQQAEKLAKAKEDCQSALDKLGNTIETHQSYFDQLKEAHETVKAKMKELDDVLAQLKIQYADIEEMLNDLIAKQTSNQYADKIGKLQDSLNNLADNIAKLENQRQIISGQIEQLEDPMLRYDLQIQKAIDISNQLLVLLASATDIADVETMTELATNESNALSSNGVDDYNQFVDYYSMVVNNLNIYINNVIIVGNQAESLENDVNETITGIGNVIVDDSEILGRYDMKGNRVDSTYKGVQIIRLKNGKSIKINVK